MSRSSDTGRTAEALRLFVTLVDLDPDERDRRLVALGARDRALHDEVRRLLLRDAETGDALDDRHVGRHVGRGLGRPAHPLLPERVGRYRITGVLGQGGMGVVYRAEQPDPRRTVAVKVMRSALASEELLARFRREAESLGRLDHPGIARVIEAGSWSTETGELPFLAMELVDGLPIVQYAERHGCTVAERLRLLARVCDALEHAHQRGVVHRDLKPDNVLVDAAGRPRVLDFGVARLLDDDADQSLLTRTGQALGTLDYMSPEQFAGSASTSVGAACDVWALGVIGYELLAGRRPHDLDEHGLAEAARIVTTVDAPPLRLWSPSLRGDPETILAKALAIEPPRRYPTAGAFAEDIRRHLRDQPVAARRPSTVYLVGKFVRRHRALVFGTLATVVALAIGLVSTTLFALREHDQRRAADEARERLRENLYRAEMRLAGDALQSPMGAILSRSWSRRWHPDGVDRPDLRGWEWFLLTSVTARDLWSLDGTANQLVWWDPVRLFAADGPAPPLGILRDDGSDMEQWAARRFQGPAPSPDGRRIVASYLAPHPGLFDPRSGDLIAALDLGGSRTAGSILRIEWSRDGGAFATRLFPDSQALALVRVFDAEDGHLLGEAPGHDDEPSVAMSFSADGSRFAANAPQRADAAVYDVGDWSRVQQLAGPGSALTWLAFHPLRRSLLAAGHANGTVVLHELERDEPPRASHHHALRVTGLAWSHDGTMLVSTSLDHSVVLWRIDTDLLTRLGSHDRESVVATFSPDDTRVATAGKDDRVRIWSTERPGALTTLVREGADLVTPPRWSADDCRLAVSFRAGTSKILDVASGAVRRVVPGNSLRISADEQLEVFARDRNVLQVHRADDADALLGSFTLASQWRRTALAFHPRDQLLAFASAVDRPPRVWLWDLASAAPPEVLCTESTMNLHWHPDGVRLAVRTWSDRLAIWDVAQQVRLADRKLADRAVSFAWSPDGARYALGLRDARILIHDTEDGAVVAELEGHAGGVLSLAWHPDGARLASGSDDQTVRLWDPRARVEVLSLDHPERVFQLAWSHHGHALATVDARGAVRIFDAGQARATGR